MFIILIWIIYIIFSIILEKKCLAVLPLPFVKEKVLKQTRKNYLMQKKKKKKKRNIYIYSSVSASIGIYFSPFLNFENDKTQKFQMQTITNGYDFIHRFPGPVTCLFNHCCINSSASFLLYGQACTGETDMKLIIMIFTL